MQPPEMHTLLSLGKLKKRKRKMAKTDAGLHYLQCFGFEMLDALTLHTTTTCTRHGTFLFSLSLKVLKIVEILTKLKVIELKQ